MPENNSMVNRNTGDITEAQALQAFEAFTSVLDDRLGSLTTQMKSLYDLIEKQIKLDQKANADFVKSVRTLDNDVKVTGNSQKEFKKSLDKMNKESDRNKASLERQKRNLSGSTRNIDAIAIDKEIKVVEAHKKRLNALNAEIEAKTADTERSKQQLYSASAILKNLRKQYKASGKDDKEIKAALEDQKKKVKEAVKIYRENNTGLETSLSNLQRNIDAANKDMRDTRERNEREMRPLREAIAEGDNAFKSLGSQSAIIARFLNRQEGTQEEQFQKAIEQTAESLTHAVNQINARLNEIGDDNSDESKDLIKQRKILEEQLKETKKLSPALEKTAQLFKDIKGSLGNTIKNITKNLLSTVESKYLDAYLTGFQNVYQSIESTRGEISARLRMDQGEFSSLQEEISNLIEERGLTGSISSIDTNEALQQLVASGVTDERILKEFSIMQAKLKAEGSSLNLTNEEMLTRTLSQINKAVAGGTSFDDAMAEMSAMFEATAQAEIYAREKYGQDIALVNGAEDQIVNMVTNIDTSLGKSTEEMTKDIQEAIVNAMSLQAAGIDSTAFLSQVQALVNGDITQQSTLGQVMMMKGLMPEDFIGKSFGEAYDTILESYRYAFENKGENYIATLASTYGSSMDVGDIRRLVNSSGEITTTLSDSDYDTMAKIQTESNEALADATYLSATEAWMTKMENAATDEAIAAEKLYEGDKKYLAVVGGIYDGVKDIVDILTQYAFTGFSGGGFSAFGGTGSGGSTTFGNFMTGASGTKAGALGKGLGVAAGVGIAGYSVVTNAIDAESFEEFADTTLRDQTFATGIGTALGSAIAGPVGGVVGGAIYGAANQLGNAWYDKIISEPADSGLTAASMELEEAADAMTESATNQYKSAKKEYDRLNTIFEDQDIEEMRMILLTSNNLSREEANSKTAEEIQDIFKENVMKQQEILMMDADIKGKNAELIKENSQKIANSSREMLEAYEEKTVDSGGLLDSSFLYKDMSAEELADKFLSEESGMSKFVGSLGGSQSATELFSSFNADENMTNDMMRSALMSFGYSASELENYGDTRLRQMYSNAMLSDFAKQAGYDDFSTQVLKKTYDKYKDNHAVYLEADSKFQDNWKKAIESVPESNRNSFASVYNAYIPITGDPELDNTVDVNNVHLVEHFGYDSVDNYKFKTGLTSVPFDSYPAYLHTGERVLTKEEARAYNELSANAVEQLSKIDVSNTYKADSTLDKSILDKIENLFAKFKNDVSDNDSIKVDISDMTDTVISKNNNLLSKIENMFEDFNKSTLYTESVGNDNIFNIPNDVELNNYSSFMSDYIVSDSESSNTTKLPDIENMLNSEHLGTDRLNKSIESQTTTLERKLDMVIGALNTLIVALRPTGRSVTSDANVMSMNSNITQLATAK